MDTPDLRNFHPSAGQAKHVDDTKMLQTEARETPDTVKATNETKEYVTKSPAFGPLGAMGRH